MLFSSDLGSFDWDALKDDLRNFAAEAQDKVELLEGIGKRFFDLPGIMLVWVGLIDKDGQTVIPIFEAGSCGSYIDNNKFVFDDSDLGVLVGQADQTRLPKVITDAGSDPAYEPWREQAKAYGFASCAVLPLMPAGNLCGFLTLYSSNPRAFTNEVQKRLGEIIQLITSCAVH